MQHWLDKLTDITALQGDESVIKQALGNLTSEAGFGGYAYLHIQPGHTGEHEDLWGGLERRMSSSLNFDGTGGCEKGKTGSDENRWRGGSLGG